MRSTLKALTICAALTLPHAADASVVHDDRLNDTSIFNPATVILGPGHNDILGSASLGSPSDFDAYTLIVGSGRRIISILMSATQAHGVGTFTAIVWELREINALASVSFLQDVNGLPASAFAGSLPLESGTYTLSTFGYTGFRGNAPSVSADYTIRVTVAPIPLPAGLTLLAGALGLLTLVGWRRRTA